MRLLKNGGDHLLRGDALSRLEPLLQEQNLAELANDRCR
jgi:hypothetical protein